MSGIAGDNLIVAGYGGEDVVAGMIKLRQTLIALTFLGVKTVKATSLSTLMCTMTTVQTSWIFSSKFRCKSTTVYAIGRTIFAVERSWFGLI